MVVFVILGRRHILMSNVIPLGGSYNAAEAQRDQYLRGIAASNQQSAYNQGYGIANQSAQNQQALAAIKYNSALQAAWGAQQVANRQKPFKINGKEMELTEFVDTLFPEDCPERSYLILRLTKGENDE